MDQEAQPEGSDYKECNYQHADANNEVALDLYAHTEADAFVEALHLTASGDFAATDLSLDRDSKPALIGIHKDSHLLVDANAEVTLVVAPKTDVALYTLRRAGHQSVPWTTV
eukprot:1567107-Amphidinium_carterae.1